MRSHRLVVTPARLPPPQATRSRFSATSRPPSSCSPASSCTPRGGTTTTSPTSLPRGPASSQLQNNICYLFICGCTVSRAVRATSHGPYGGALSSWSRCENTLSASFWREKTRKKKSELYIARQIFSHAHSAQQTAALAQQCPRVQLYLQRAAVVTLCYLDRFNSAQCACHTSRKLCLTPR